MEPAAQKAALRREIRARIAGISVEKKQEFSRAACALMRSRPEWAAARMLALYVPMADELDCRELLREALSCGKRVALPAWDAALNAFVLREVRTPDSELASGYRGILEPHPGCPIVNARLDLTLVPGVAFDSSGSRLGRGKGFYDRILRKAGGLTCGAAFDERIVHRVPVEPHDIRVNCILTPSRWTQCAAHHSSLDPHPE